jgi:hypothetical protein
MGSPSPNAATCPTLEQLRTCYQIVTSLTAMYVPVLLVSYDEAFMADLRRRIEYETRQEDRAG